MELVSQQEIKKCADKQKLKYAWPIIELTTSWGATNIYECLNVNNYPSFA
jgi:hypothetical protein